MQDLQHLFCKPSNQLFLPSPSSEVHSKTVSPNRKCSKCITQTIMQVSSARRVVKTFVGNSIDCKICSNVFSVNFIKQPCQTMTMINFV